MNLTTLRQKAVHIMLTVLAVLAYLTAMQPEATSLLGRILPTIPQSHHWGVWLAGGIGMLLALFSRLPQMSRMARIILARLEGQTGKTPLLLLAATLSLSSCAWFQKHPVSQVVGDIVDCTKTVCAQQPGPVCEQIRAEVTACVAGALAGLPESCFDLVSVPNGTVAFQDVACVWQELASTQNKSLQGDVVADEARKLIAAHKATFASVAR